VNILHCQCLTTLIKGWKNNELAMLTIAQLLNCGQVGWGIWLGMCSDYWVGAQCCLFPGSEFECSLYSNCENGSSCWLNNVIPWLRGLLIVNICWRIIEVIAETIWLKFFFIFKWRHNWFSTHNALGSVMLLGGVLAIVCLLIPISMYKRPDSNIVTAGFPRSPVTYDNK
jgi:hypothetical protein